ncbi:MAG: acetylornithine deacetylase [Granulosicoccus sp.]
MSTLDILEKLIAFDTVSANPNIALIHWLEELLCNAGATVTCLCNAAADKANLYATIGPTDKPGILLSGHTDVVPVSGQNWSVPPFAMTVNDGKVYGRGSADMKGFVASAVRIALLAAQRELQTPLHLGFSYDEEIGCVGVRSMIDMLDLSSVKPLMCIVGEPTEMNIASGHKGKTACHVTCIGKAGHSALAPNAVNAIHLATDLIEKVRKLQCELAQSGNNDTDYDIPYTTLHISNIRGGVALNIVPDCCTFDLEIRNLHQDNPLEILQQVEAAAREIVDNSRPPAAETDIHIETFNTYPGLNTDVHESVVAFVRSLTDGNQLFKVAFGTEGGLFSSKLGIPTVVCGPGSMDQGHKADEFVSLEQLRRCDRMMDNLLNTLENGISQSH